MDEKRLSVNMGEYSQENFDENVYVETDDIKELLVRRGGNDGGVSNKMMSTSLLSSLSLPDKLSTMVIAMKSDQVNIPAGTGVIKSEEVIEMVAGILPDSNSTLSYLESSSHLSILKSQSSWSAEEIGAVSIASLMVPFILFSNLIVIICVIRFRRLHTPTNYFITSLAAVDILVALATPFVIVVEVFHFGDPTGPRDVILCLLPNRVLMMTCGVSVLTLAAIAYDRHTALVSPLEYVKIMTSKKVAIMVSLSWIYSIIIVWFPLMVGWYDVPSDVAPCSANLIHGKAPVLFLCAIFVPSCIAILVCYFRIFMVARHHVKAIAAVELALHRPLHVKAMVRDTKYAKTLALVISVFLFLWLPYLMYIFIKTVRSVKFNIWVQTYLILLTVFNSGINPWIYAFMNNELRTAFKRLFRQLCGDRFCWSVLRRSSLVSGINSTPRLSLTDSKVISIISDVTVNSHCDQPRIRLDSMQEFETRQSRADEVSSHADVVSSQADEVSYQAVFVDLNQSGQHAKSCSNLDVLRGVNMRCRDSLTRSRSISVDITRTIDLPKQTADAVTTELAKQTTDIVTRQLPERTAVESFHVGEPLICQQDVICEDVQGIEQMNKTTRLVYGKIRTCTASTSTIGETICQLQLPSTSSSPRTLPQSHMCVSPFLSLVKKTYTAVATSPTPASPTDQSHMTVPTHTTLLTQPHMTIFPTVQPHSTLFLPESHPSSEMEDKYRRQSYSSCCHSDVLSCCDSNVFPQDTDTLKDIYASSVSSFDHTIEQSAFFTQHRSCDCVSLSPIKPCDIHSLSHTKPCDPHTTSCDTFVKSCDPHSTSCDPHTRLSPMLGRPVATYYLLLPIYETLALNVISTVARLEHCTIDLVGVF